MNVIKKSNTAWDFIIESLAVKNMLFQSNARMMPCMVNYHSEFFQVNKLLIDRFTPNKQCQADCNKIS